MSVDRALDVLLLCDYRTDIAATVRDHIDALRNHSRHRIHVVSILGDLPPRLNLDYFDAVVVHYSLVACDDAFVSRSARASLAAFRGAKAMFIQDEYRFIDATIGAMQKIGIDLLFTCVPTSEIENVYPSSKLPAVRKVNVLTGYVPEALLSLSVPRYRDRPIDVGYRARKVPAWLGDLGQEKYNIGRTFQSKAVGSGLMLDISYREEDRLYGDAWIEFMTRCKATLGVESGASVFDFTGQIQRSVDEHMLRDPDVDYATLRKLYFEHAEGQIRLNQISPRCFEAAALKTLMVLYEGDYSGRLVAHRHYVPLKRDHSNQGEVIAIIRNEQLAEAIIEAAYAEVACNPSNGFKVAVEEFDVEIEAAARRKDYRRTASLAQIQLEKMVAPSWRTRRTKLRRGIIEGAYRIVFGDLLRWASPAHRERLQWWIRRVVNRLRIANRRRQD